MSDSHDGPHVAPTMNPFTQKIGKFPVAVWAAIVVGVGGLAYLYVKHRNTAVPGNAATTDYLGTVTDPTAAGGTGMPWSYGGGTTGGSGFSSGSGIMGTPASSTNAIWASNVANGMIATGTQPGDVQGALSKYLGGQQLNATEQAIVNLAVQHYGTPPEGIIPLVTTPPATAPTPTPTNPPVSHAPTPPPKAAPHWGQYAIAPSDNLQKIAIRFYGSAAAKYVNSLRVANPAYKSVGTTQSLKSNAGQKVFIPHVN